MIKLYINNLEADLGDNDIKFNITKFDYNNPTIKKNSYSQTIELPAIGNNNIIFTSYFDVNSKYINGSFNPSKRVPFKIVLDGLIIEEGYVKLNSISRNGIETKYSITLFGELGAILNSLKYKELTDEVLKLSDLNFKDNLQFNINKETIKEAWDRLDNLDASPESIFDTINFAYTYDGVPELNNFDTNKCFINLNDYLRNWFVKSDEGGNFYSNIPQAYNDKGTPITYSSSAAYKRILDIFVNSKPYGLIEMSDKFSSQQIRDIRSYLVRPIIRVKKLFEAISNYTLSNTGYSIRLIGDFFESDDFNNIWITLSCLYESNKDIKSDDLIDKNILLNNTNSPADYIINFCKIFNLYIDVDIFSKQMKIGKYDEFFEDKILNLNPELNDEITITPLLFDKASYIFNYTNLDTDITKNYKEQTGLEYSSKKVNTGYQFNTESKNYIDGNIFKNGADTMESNARYCYDYIPSPFFDNQLTHKLGLFDNNKAVKYSEIRPEFSKKYYTVVNKYFSGIQRNIFYDYCPRLCCSNDGKIADAKNILVKYNGKPEMINVALNISNVGSNAKELSIIANSFVEDIPSEVEPAHFCITDDVYTEYNEGKRCWLYTTNDSQKAIDITAVPQFTRIKYNYTSDATVKNQFGGNLYLSPVLGTLSKNASKNAVFTSNSAGIGGPTTNFSFVKDHKYFVCALAYSQTYYNLESTTVVIDGITPIDYSSLDTNNWSIISSLFVSDINYSSKRVYFCQSNNTNQFITVSYFKIFDLTELGLEQINSVSDAISIFGLGKGIYYLGEESLEFSNPNIIYIPSTILDNNKDIYSRYWRRYIEEIYSVDNKKFKATFFIEGKEDFNKFWYYNGSLFVISSVDELDYNTNRCKATFIKVIDKSVYTK